MQHRDITKPDMALGNAERRKRFRQLETVKHQILDADRRILARYRSSEVGGRLDDIPGVCPLTATALVASVPDPHAFKSGLDLAPWRLPPWRQRTISRFHDCDSANTYDFRQRARRHGACLRFLHSMRYVHWMRAIRIPRYLRAALDFD